MIPDAMGATKRAAQNRNDAQIEAKKLLTDPAYTASVLDRIKRGELAPQVETMLWHYAYGKPPDVIQVEGGTLIEQLEQLSDAQLAQRAARAVERLEAAAAVAVRDQGFDRFEEPPTNGSIN